MGYQIMLSYFKNLFAADLPPADKKTLRELQSLTDRELEDIGIHRSQVPLVARGWHPQHGWAGN